MRGRVFHERMRSMSEWDRRKREAKRNIRKIPVAMRLRDTPVLIPNTMVKT